MDIHRPVDGQELASNVSHVRRDLTHETLGTSDAKRLDTLQEPRPQFSNLGQLTDQLREIPEVRSELVAAATVKLQQGVFLTRKSAEDTARAIVRLLT